MKKNKNILNKEIKVLRKINTPIVNFSEKYCQNIDFQTAIKSLPLIGGYLDNLFTYKGSKIIQERVNKFFEMTKITLKQLQEEKIDKKYFDSDECFYIFQKIYEQIIRCNEKEKIGLFRNILINSISINKSNVYHKERFINMVANLAIIHIQILKFYINREIVFKKENRQDNQCFTSLHSVCQKTDLTESQAEAFCSDLVRYDMLYDSMIGKYGYKRNYFRITNYAIEFMDFIENIA